MGKTSEAKSLLRRREMQDDAILQVLRPSPMEIEGRENLVQPVLSATSGHRFNIAPVLKYFLHIYFVFLLDDFNFFLDICF